MAKRTVDQSAAIEARWHQHDYLPQGHLHRRGNEEHGHDDDSRPIFPQPRDPATGKFVSRDGGWFDPSPDANTTELPTVRPDGQPQPDPFDPELLLREVDQDFAEHAHALGEIGRSVLLELDMAELDRECEAFNATVERFAAETHDLERFIDFAEAAQAIGHHPVAAYCYAADRFDPEGAAP